jgi:hypothetical protein
LDATLLDLVEGIVDAIHSIRAGCVLYKIVPLEDFQVHGFGYKAVKMVAYAGAKALSTIGIPRSGYIHVSPPIPPGRGPLGLWISGWRPPEEVASMAKPTLLRAGVEYYVRIGWASAEGEDAARALGEELESSGLASVDLVTVEDATVRPAHKHEATLALATPAQFKIVSWSGEERVVANPCPARLLQAPLRVALGIAGLGQLEAQAAMSALTIYVAQTGGSWRPVTIYIDRRRPSAWAVAGWARLTLTRGAPEHVGRLLGLLHGLALYTGVGKSRMEGLGMAGEALAVGREVWARIPCIPWPLKAA